MKLEKAYVLHGEMIGQMLKFVFQRLELYQTYAGLVRERMMAVNLLINQNLLSPLLISPVELQTVFDKVSRELRVRYPKFQIAVSSANALYKIPGVAYTWDQSICTYRYEYQYLLISPSTGYIDQWL